MLFAGLPAGERECLVIGNAEEVGHISQDCFAWSASLHLEPLIERRRILPADSLGKLLHCPALFVRQADEPLLQIVPKGLFFHRLLAPPLTGALAGTVGP